MTDDHLIYADEFGNVLTFDRHPDGGGLLRASDKEDTRGFSLRVSKNIADALLLAATSAGPDAVLRDVRPLLEQCAREDTNPTPDRRGLYTSEIRMILRVPQPCGAVSATLGARCGRNEHTGDDNWHVDPEREIRWRNFGEGFEVRGWTPGDES